jgi:hypothetical protein
VRHSLLKELSGMLLERGRQAAGNAHRWVAAPSLNAAQISHINLGVMRKLLLRELALNPQPSHICPDDLVPVHRAGWSLVGAKPLGTIIPIRLTLPIRRAESRHVRFVGP